MVFITLQQAAAAEAGSDVGCLTAIITWAPMVLMLGFWIWYIRRMGYFSKNKGYIPRTEEHMRLVEETLNKIEEHLRKIAERDTRP